MTRLKREIQASSISHEIALPGVRAGHTKSYISWEALLIPMSSKGLMDCFTIPYILTKKAARWRISYRKSLESGKHLSNHNLEYAIPYLIGDRALHKAPLHQC